MAGMSGDHHQELQQAYKSVWDEEEEQRESAWLQLLLRNTVRESGKQYDIKQLADIGLHEVITVHDTLMSDLVLHGFPMCIRGEGWKLLLDVSVRRHKGHYKLLVQQTLGALGQKETISLDDLRTLLATSEAPLDSTNTQLDTSASANARPAPNSPTWNNVGPSWQSHARVWLQQIEKDLPRTFAGHPSMQPVKGGRQALRRVLAAYTMQDPATGYCQGMNYIAAVLLMFMPEEDAFWCLAIIVEQVLAGYFAPDMMAIKVDQRVFQQLVSSQLPALATHLQAVGADIACLFAQWFLCAFVNSLPLETCYRVWDVLFYRKSSAILFQVGLALVDMYSEALLAAHDLLEAFQVVQGMASLTHDATRLLGLAMHKYSFLSKEHLESLRRQARVLVEKEMEEEKRAEAERQLRQQGLSDSIKPLPDTNNRMQTYMRKFWAQVNLRFEGGRAAAGGSDSDARGGHGTPEHFQGDGDEEGDQEHEGSPGPLTAIQQASTSQAGASKKRASALISAFATGAQALKGSGQQSTAGLFGSNTAAATRAGNHQIPDAADSPLLVGPSNMGAAASMGTALEHVPSAGHADDVHGSYVPPDAAIAHFPPTREMIPQQGDLISLSQSFSTALPDLDDLLMRDESVGFTSLPVPLGQPRQSNPLAPTSPSLRSPTSLPNIASPTPQPPQPGLSGSDSQGAGTGFGFSVPSPVKAGLVSRPLPELSELDPPSPKQHLQTSNILKEIDSTLWSPPESGQATLSPTAADSIAQKDPFRASPALPQATACNPTATSSGTQLVQSSMPPPDDQSACAGANGSGMAEGVVSSSGRLAAADGKGARTSTTQRHSIGSTDSSLAQLGASNGSVSSQGASTVTGLSMPSRLSGAHSPQLSSAMKIAFKIAMNQTVEPASTGAGTQGSTGKGFTAGPVQHAAASTGGALHGGLQARTHFASAHTTQRGSAPGLPATSNGGQYTHGGDGTAVGGKLAAWGLEGVGSAHSNVSLGISSGPTTEDLDLHPLSAHHHGASSLSYVSPAALSGTELKDDWVDLHVADELSVHSRHSSMPGTHRSYTGGGHHGGIPLHMTSTSAAGAAAPHQQPSGFAVARATGPVAQHVFGAALHALVHQQPAVVSSMGQVPSEPESGELRKTISNGWVDGGLGTSLPNQLHPGSHTQSMERLKTSSQPPAVSDQFHPETAVTGGFASVQAAQDIREREGIQQLLAHCHDLNAQYQRAGLQSAMPSKASDTQGTGIHMDDVPSKPGALHLSLMAVGAGTGKQPTADADMAADKVLKSAISHLQQAQDELIALATVTRPTSPSVNSLSIHSGAATNGHSMQQQLAEVRHRADAAAYALKMATQELNRRLDSRATAASSSATTHLLAEYRSLASHSCAKLQAMAAQQAEQEAAHALLQHKLQQVTEQLASKDDMISQLQAQLDAVQQQQQQQAGNTSLMDNLKDIRNRLRGSGNAQQQPPLAIANTLQGQASQTSSNPTPANPAGVVGVNGLDTAAGGNDSGPNRLLAVASRFFKPSERGPSPPLQQNIHLQQVPQVLQPLVDVNGSSEQRGTAAGTGHHLGAAQSTQRSDAASSSGVNNESAAVFQHAVFQHQLVEIHGGAAGMGLLSSAPGPAASAPAAAAASVPLDAAGSSARDSSDNVGAGRLSETS